MTDDSSISGKQVTMCRTSRITVTCRVVFFKWNINAENVLVKQNSAKTTTKRLCLRQATYIMRRVVYTNWTAINAMFRGHARFVNSVRSRSYNLNNWPIKSNLPLLQGGNERLGKLDVWRGKEKWAFKTKI